MGSLLPSALVSGAATTNDHKPGGLRQQKGIRSPFWGPQGPGRGAGRRSFQSLRGEPFLASFWLRWFQVILGVSWLAAASPQSRPLLSQGVLVSSGCFDRLW